jgi:hypothetical protein
MAHFMDAGKHTDHTSLEHLFAAIEDGDSKKVLHIPSSSHNMNGAFAFVASFSRVMTLISKGQGCIGNWQCRRKLYKFTGTCTENSETWLVASFVTTLQSSFFFLTIHRQGETLLHAAARHGNKNLIKVYPYSWHDCTILFD